MSIHRTASLVVVWSFLFLPVAAWPQVVSGTIAGVVRDTSGAVVPGVTVEAASPALIERVRAAGTDGQGLYRIVDLRPGVYTVTFTLAGFNTLIREGIQLTAGFTATVNVELSVGAVEETITVSGSAPLVDTRTVGQRTTIGREVLDALPTTRRVAQLISVIPGATAVSATLHDVGGVGSERAQFGVHGQRPAQMTHNMDGINMIMQSGGGFSHNVHVFQEVVVETLAGSGEAAGSGTQVNLVQKDGGNLFSGSFSIDHTSPGLQGSNMTDALRDRGLGPAPSVRKFRDIGGGLGGPLMRNRLWFFGATRYLQRSQYQQGNYFNARQSTFVAPGVVLYEPDQSRPAHTDDYDYDYTVRLTWQAAAKHRITASMIQHPSCQCFFFLLETPGGILAAPEATRAHHYDPNYLTTAAWTYPVTDRLLFETTASFRKYNNHRKRQPDVLPGTIEILELSRNFRWGTTATDPQPRDFYRERVGISYITGSHTLKAGLELSHYFIGASAYADPEQVGGARTYRFRNGAPESVTIWAVPFGERDRGRDLGLYVQDQWTIRNLTLNAGFRFNNYNASVPEQFLPEGPFVAARSFPAVKDSPDWTNLDPRFGAAYNLFGDGRTALKVSFGRYSAWLPGSGSAAAGNPVANQATSTTRTWSDGNRNFVPDCDLLTPAANGECGPWSDLTFGRIREGNTRFADDALGGFNRQPDSNWQASMSVQRELWPNAALNVGYFRTWYRDFLATDNLAVTPADYDPYCITAPQDRRLPGGGGTQFCGLFDLRPALFGRVDNLVTQASGYGKRSEVYNGIDVTMNARFGQGGHVSGGISVGRTVTDTCFVVDSPQQARPGFCKITPPWAAGTQLKLAVVYPLPWELQASAIYQNIPGIPITASYVATNAEVLSSLGRNLGACRGAAVCNATVTVDLIPPNTVFEPRLQQLDLRLTRMLRFGRFRTQGSVDVYNAFNSSSILNMTTRYGPRWLDAIQVMGARLLKFSVRVDF